MAIRELKLTYQHSPPQTVPDGWYGLVGGNSTGIKLADIGGSGIDYRVVTAFSNSLYNSNLTNADHYGIPDRVWDEAWTRGSITPAQFALDGFLPGQPVEIDFFGVIPNAGRNRLLTVDNVQYVHVESGGTSPQTPNPPTTAYAIADEDGSVICDCISADNTTNWAGIIVRYDDAWSDGPKITKFNDTEEDFAGEYGQSCTIETSGFEGSIVSATVAGVACTGVSDTGLTLPALVDETTVPMPTEVELEVESDEAETATANITVFPPSGFNSIILGDDLNQTSTGTIFDFVPAAKEGDALFTPFVVDSEGNIIDAPAGVYDCWDLSVDDVDPNIAVARSFVVTLGGGPDPDDRPDDVRFNTVNKADLNTEYESNTVEITGINVTVDVTISGGEYRIDDGAWGSTAGTIQNGQEIQLRANSPADKNQTTAVTINVGSATFKWRIHTERDSGGVSQIPGMQVPTMRGLS